ncbi:ISAs1 family transposase [Candidatus Aerophobetes bacterium]|uniref:ISAs1 family transposase n=1 Tax=Aerophobetes bacterium TaxID=2030807 RepID=A0A2A4YFE8_UNCAE|nr:MAG: ISAs1 family transposase [Candidatus Aerophobetes bacterium]
MDEILLITLCAVIAGCEGWIDIENFGKAKLEVLQKYLPYKNGTSSDDTLRRFFRALDPKAFKENFRKWVDGLDGLKKTNTIAIDRKISRRSKDAEQDALHLVSAFATEAGLVIAQTKMNKKSNKTTAIPELIEWLDLQGSTITIDAMGCQKKIAQLIVEKHGNYVLGLKGNHKNLLEEVQTFFDGCPDCDRSQTIEKGHGRIEVRRCFVSEDISWLHQKEMWLGLKSLVMIESKRELKGENTQERRYYLSSLPADATKTLKIIRSHWVIENGVHLVLDMSFGDDASRIRKGNAPENMAIMKHSALNMIRRYKTKRQSIKGLRKQAGWDEKILQGILSCVS